MNIGIYGLGRFGSFWAAALSDYIPVKAYSRSGKEIDAENVTIAEEDEVLCCDAVFFCVPISVFPEVLDRVRGKIPDGTLVADTCSVKVLPVRWMYEKLPEEIRILGTHPMFGPDSGKNGLAGLPIVLSPVRISETELTYWIDFFGRMGLNVLRMAADDHDHQAAYTQGITHFIGRVLNDLDLSLHPLSTLGFQKMLEVMEQTCNDPWQLFLDLQRFNPYTGEMREKLKKSLDKMLIKLGGKEEFGQELSPEKR